LKVHPVCERVDLDTFFVHLLRHNTISIQVREYALRLTNVATSGAFFSASETKRYESGSRPENLVRWQLRPDLPPGIISSNYQVELALNGVIEQRNSGSRSRLPSTLRYFLSQRIVVLVLLLSRKIPILIEQFPYVSPVKQQTKVQNMLSYHIYSKAELSNRPNLGHSSLATSVTAILDLWLGCYTLP
jgi:hypothetical protein